MSVRIDDVLDAVRDAAEPKPTSATPRRRGQRRAEQPGALGGDRRERDERERAAGGTRPAEHDRADDHPAVQTPISTP